MTSSLRAHASLGAVVLAWAAAFPTIKELLERGIVAEDIALVRYLVAAPGFVLLLWRVGWLRGLTRGDAARVAAAGLLIVAGYHLSLNLGTRHTTSGTSALVVGLAPAMTLLVAAWVGLERFSLVRAAGIGLAFGGLAVAVLLGGGEEISFSNAKGPLIVLGAPVAFALYNVILKPLLGRYDLLALTSATSLVGTIALLPLARGRTFQAFEGARASTVLLLLFLGLACTLLGYVAWNVGLKGIGASRAVAYTYAISPLGLALGAVLLDELVTAWLALGAALIVVGLVVAQRGGRSPAGLTSRRYAAASSSISTE